MNVDRAEAIAIADDCAREPIHIPGRIQPHGFLLAYDVSTRLLTHVSGNVEIFIGLDPVVLIGASLQDVIVNEALVTALMQTALIERQPIALGTYALGNRQFFVVAHRQTAQIIVEFEPLQTGDVFAETYPVVDAFVTKLQRAQSVEEVCRFAVEEVQRLTQFGRVLAYCFDEDGHGDVIAEVVEAGYDAYLGLRFPASDIPAQARELYRLNRVRTIPDANYTPVPLLADAAQAAPLDLSFAHLRSVSPVHVQYMKNMNTLASMSMSIMVGDRLWGLISCHHALAKSVTSHIRIACDLLGKILSLQVEAREAQAENARLLDSRRMLVELLAAIADREFFADGLLEAADTLLAFVRASGVAIVVNDDYRSAGVVPDEPMLRRIVDWLDTNNRRDIFSTSNLEQVNPEFAACASTASGMLALSISELYPNYILWFRPEIVKAVQWAGQPAKTRVISSAGVPQLSPRTSFTAWSEIVRGQALRWENAELEAAIEFRSAVLGIVLRQAEELAELADELQRSNSELESFSYSVSHDLRAPLRHIAGFADLLADDIDAAVTERGRRYLKNITDSARFAGTLVDELLSFSQMGRSALRPRSVNLNAIIDHIRSELAPDVGERRIEWVVESLPVVQGDTAFLHLALRNLLANAIKYTRTRDHARIEIGVTDARSEHVIYCRDNGVGFDMQYVDKLFGVFQRLHRAEEFEGTGIGLANVRRIIERHGGRVWAEAVMHKGATFYFALPHVIPEELMQQRKKHRTHA